MFDFPLKLNELKEKQESKVNSSEIIISPEFWSERWLSVISSIVKHGSSSLPHPLIFIPSSDK
jgi:hypothetical protein